MKCIHGRDKHICHFLFLHRYWKDDEIIGQFRIRHYLCDSLKEGGGHIGYYIGKTLRGRGYGTEGLRLTLQVAKDIIPEDRRVYKFGKAKWYISTLTVRLAYLLSPF